VVESGAECWHGKKPFRQRAREFQPPGHRTRRWEKISQYGCLTTNGSKKQPVEGVIPYDLNSAFVRGLAEKVRFVGAHGHQGRGQRREALFEFPVGTIIAKTFAYPPDARAESWSARLIEDPASSSAKRQAAVGLPYIWNADTDRKPTLDVAGDTVVVRWIDDQGREDGRTNDISPTPTRVQRAAISWATTCKPIGPRRGT